MLTSIVHCLLTSLQRIFINYKGITSYPGEKFQDNGALPFSTGGRNSGGGGWPPHAFQEEVADTEDDTFFQPPERSRTGARYGME
jgi:hypothetical protein